MPLDEQMPRKIHVNSKTVNRAIKINIDDEFPPDLGVPHIGNHHAPIVVVLDPVISARPFNYPIKNDDMNWLAPRILEYSKLGRDDVQFLAAAPFITFEQNGKDREVTAHLKKYEAAFDEAIIALKPKLIVPMGARAARQIFGKAVQITKVRGAVIEETAKFGKIPILPVMSPFYARRHPENEALFCADIETLGRVVDSGYSSAATSARDDMQIEWCYDISELLRKPPSLLSVDVEGIGLEPFKPETKLLTVQLTHESGKSLVIPIDYDAGVNRHHRFIDWIKVCNDHGISYVDPITKRRRLPRKQSEAHEVFRKRILRQLKQLLENPKVRCIGQNLKFDWLYLNYKADIQIANYYGDTLLMAHLLDENMLTKNIDDLTRVYIPEYSGYNDLLNRDPEHQGKSRMDLLTPDKMLRYAGGDTIVAFQLYNRLLDLLQRDKKLYSCYMNTVMRGVRGFCYVELNGFTVNVDALREFEKYLIDIQKSTKEWLLAQLPKSIVDKWKNSGVGLKPDRAAILIDYLYEHPDGLRLQPKVYTKTGLPSVSTKLAMPYYLADYEFVRRLVEYNKNQKMLSTYVKGFYKYIVDGKIRPTFLLHSTTTGRSSSKNPNGQNFPKRGKMAKIFRRIFQAPKGWVYGQSDLSQAELRIASMISGDEHMMQVYLDGGDIHRATAAGVMGLSINEFLALDSTTQSLERYHAKAVNFGFLYGMWWKKFKEYAKTDYGVDFTDEEAAHIRQMFFETYPRLLEWHQKTEKFVRKHKFVRAFNGRIRHLPMVDSPDESLAKQAVRQAVNCVSDDTQILTKSGWKTVDQLSIGELVYSVNPLTGRQELHPLTHIHHGFVDQDMHHFEGRAFRAITTPNHRWLVSSNKNHKFVESSKLQMTGHHKIMLSSKGVDSLETQWTDDEVRLIGWVLTDGYYKRQISFDRKTDYSRARVGITQSKEKYLDDLVALANSMNMTARNTKGGQWIFEVSCDAAARMRIMMPHKTLTPEFLHTLSTTQLKILYDTMLKGDGSWDNHANRFRKFTCDTKERADVFLMLCSMIGITARAKWRDMSGYVPISSKMHNVPKMNGVWNIELCVNKYAQPQYGHSIKRWAGRVWCPTVKYGNWVAKRQGTVFVTGNSPVQSFASDIGLMAIGLLMPYLRNTGMDRYIKVCGFIHDSIVYLVREDKAAVASRTIKKFMENIPYKKWFGWEPTVPIIAEVELGRNLADTYECKLRHYSNESGNRTFRQIEVAILNEDLSEAISKVEKVMLGKSREEYNSAISIVHEIEKKLGVELTDFETFPADRGRFIKSKFRRAYSINEVDNVNRIASKVRKPYSIKATTTEHHDNGKAKNQQRTVRKIRRIPNAA